MERLDINHVSKGYRAPTIVTEGSKLTGSISINGKVHIDGDVSGTLEASSEISVGEKGVVQCKHLKSHSLVVSGFVESDIESEYVKVMNKGVIKGNLSCKNLSIDYGGIVDAICKYRI